LYLKPRPHASTRPQIFKALSDPTRLKLITLLGSYPPHDCSNECNGHSFLCVNALARHLGVSQSAVSQHLRVLRQAGIVDGTRRGAFMHYSLDPEGLQAYKAILKETLGEDFFG
jgi:DNA-binding transcriptional ArsR family regulator